MVLELGEDSDFYEEIGVKPEAPDDATALFISFEGKNEGEEYGIRQFARALFSNGGCEVKFSDDGVSLRACNGYSLKAALGEYVWKEFKKYATRWETSNNSVK